MIDLAAIRGSFPEIQDLNPLLQVSGQKDVLRGAMGGAPVVLKLIQPNQNVERVRREIEAVATLACDYVPAILDYGQRAINGYARFYIVERFVEGETYRRVLERAPKPPLADVLHLADALLRACRDFEARQLVHRDIKPENIIVAPDGKVWIIDFGIVRFLDRKSLTPTQDQFGPSTLGYGAPEQVRNLKTKIDSRSDLFSIGVVLYESLHGCNPHREGKRGWIEMINHVTGQDLPRLTIAGDSDGQLSEFVSALCARFQSRRPPSAADALEWFLPIRDKLLPGSR